MPVQQHSTTRPADDDPAAAGAEGGTVPVETVERVDESPSPLPGQIERARLRAQISALERELAARERRHEAIVRQYELILEDRSTTADGDRRRPGSASLLERLFGTDR
ncbi:hypothetical protein [Halovivax limisalsi]|uniref:hypothetical protein n=1 Tax=Halovivax limisalsi TaxID=1453760 RepID=UPI001FFC4F83|nr:hypothetical protein [Halovivax limisalsi]